MRKSQAFKGFVSAIQGAMSIGQIIAFAKLTNPINLAFTAVIGVGFIAASIFNFKNTFACKKTIKKLVGLLESITKIKDELSEFKLLVNNAELNSTNSIDLNEVSEVIRELIMQ